LAWLVLLVIALMAPLGAKAQIGGAATIQGTVTDPSGAVIVGANVTAQSVATGAKMTRAADKAGYYVLSPVDPGDYTITATAKGFEQLVRENVHVDGMQVLGLNLTMQIGSTNITVTVTDVPPPLETENATLGSVMENQVYQSLPLEMGAAGSQDQRRATDFAALMPGVSANETKNNETDEPMVVNGNQAASEMYLDGIPVTSISVAGDPRYIWSAFSVETIDQFQLKTAAYSSEYRGLGIENFTIKSGTNKIHGTVYDVMRNTAFDAAGFIPAHYNDLNGVTHWYTPPEHMNEYGASLGGPVWRDKVFLFANYMGYRFSSVTTPAYQSVPTLAMRAGDFSGVLGPLVKNQTTIYTNEIFDPTTETCTTATSCNRSPYYGTSYTGVANTMNVLPTTEISPISLKMASLLPAPSNSANTGNYLGSYPWGLNNWSQTERLDADLSSKNKVSFIFAAGRQGLIGPAGSQSTNVAPLPYLYAKSYRPVTKDAIFEDTYLISSNLVNQFKYAALQYNGPSINPTYGVAAWEASGYGITGLPTVGQTGQTFPDITFNGKDQANWGGQSSGTAVVDNYTLVDNLQLIAGKHSIAFGGQYQWLGYNYSATGYSPSMEGSSLLSLTADPTETADLVNSASILSGTGYDYASYMLGAYHAGTYTEYAPMAQETGTRFHPFALFVNDDYKWTSKLTVNAGLRWDVLPPMREAQNRFSFMNPALTNPYSQSPGALEFAGYGKDSCNCKTPMKTYFKNWGPRLGFAYAANDKTVIRASAGMYYALGGGVGGTGNSTQPGSALELGYSAAPSPVSPGYALPVFYLNGNTGVTKTTIGPFGTTAAVTNDPTNQNFGGAGYVPVAPPIFDPGYATFYSTAVAGTADNIASTLGYLDPKYGARAPEFIGWSFGFQRSITKDMTATVSYVGNEGHFLLASGSERGLYADQMDPKYLALTGCLNAKVSALAGAGASCGPLASGNPTQTLATLGLSMPFTSFLTSQNLSQMLLPFPQYKGVTDEVGSVSNSSYNSLQLSINQRLAHGLTMMLNYTFSKSLDNAGTFRSGYAIPASVSADGKNWALGKADRSLSTFDQRQDVTGTATYDLPFGKGHIGGGNSIVSSIASGWRLSGIFTYVGGNPLSITSSTCSNVSGQGTCMPAYNTINSGAYPWDGSIRQNGGWGHGATRETLSTIQYINPAAFVQTGQLTNPYVVGDAARTAPFGLRGPGNDDIDGSIRRTFDLWNKENVKFVFEANVFNLENHVWFGTTSGNAASGATIGQSVTSSSTCNTLVTPNTGDCSLGVVAGQANLPRQWQFAGHIVF
jgi:hypothetical protein